MCLAQSPIAVIGAARRAWSARRSGCKAIEWRSLTRLRSGGRMATRRKETSTLITVLLVRHERTLNTSFWSGKAGCVEIRGRLAESTRKAFGWIHAKERWVGRQR